MTGEQYRQEVAECFKQIEKLYPLPDGYRLLEHGENLPESRKLYFRDSLRLAGYFLGWGEDDYLFLKRNGERDTHLACVFCVEKTNDLR